MNETGERAWDNPKVTSAGICVPRGPRRAVFGGWAKAKQQPWPSGCSRATADQRSSNRSRQTSSFSAFSTSLIRTEAVCITSAESPRRSRAEHAPPVSAHTQLPNSKARRIAHSKGTRACMCSRRSDNTLISGIWLFCRSVGAPGAQWGPSGVLEWGLALLGPHNTALLNHYDGPHFRPHFLCGDPTSAPLMTPLATINFSQIWAKPHFDPPYIGPTLAPLKLLCDPTMAPTTTHALALLGVPFGPHLPHTIT